MSAMQVEAFAPGEFLRDELDERGWTVTEFAEILGRPVQAVSEILNGKKEITTDTAVELASALGTSAELWLNLQTAFRLAQSRQRDRTDELSAVARRARLRALVPLAEIRKRGWVPPGDDLDALEAAVMTLLDVPDLDAGPAFALAARRANADVGLTVEQIAWLARVRQTAAGAEVAEFDRPRVAEVAAALPRGLADGEAGLVQVPALLADAGVTVVFVEGLRGGKIDGAAMFLDDGRAVIGLSTRYDRFDSLLFTLLHECAHLAAGHITAGSATIIDEDIRGDQVDPNEIEANEIAHRWTFPDGFEMPPSMSAGSLVAAARHYGVHSSVIIGQVQRRTGQWNQHRNRIPKVRPVLDEAGLLS